MQVQWYPGHMHKALKEIKATLPEIDVFLEIVDARIPYSSQNPSLAELRGNKPVVRVLAKSDLADQAVTQRWLEYFAVQEGSYSLALCREDKNAIAGLNKACQQMVKSPRHPGLLSVLVSGIPNVGKSTLINAMTGRSVAKTGNEPAVTKGLQRIKLSDSCWLYDTPGVLWPNIEHPNSGYRLATCGAVRDTAMDYSDVALFAAEELLCRDLPVLASRYGLSTSPPDATALIEAVGRSRGALVGGGRVDMERASKAFISDIRDGTLGPLSWETPEDAQREAIELLKIREEKIARKAARRAKNRE